MSKLICDVCGTSYAETAAQCPICGCARTESTGVLFTEQGESAAASYTYVKGGRFSKANVRKRNQALQSGSAADLPRSAEKENSGNKWLILIAALLVAAIVAVVLFIILHFVGAGNSQPIDPVVTEPSASVQTEPSTDPSTEPSAEATDPSIPCTGMELVKAEIALATVGEAYQLEVTLLPADTTDDVVFTSMDETVATVDETGKVTAVASGETCITITCGQVVKECKVICTLEPDTPVPPSFQLKLNRKDFTLFSKGESWDVYDDDALLEASFITWMSDDPAIAAVENGVVTATGSGSTKIRAKLEDQEVICIVRCEFPGYSGSGGVTEEGGGSVGTYQISHTDVTLRLSNDKSFRLTLTDGNGNPVSVNWTVDNSSVCAVSGNKITALKTGTTTVRVTYGGQTYKCIVRVYE